MTGGEVLWLAAIVVLLIVIAVFAAAETSFTRMSRARAEALTDDESADAPSAQLLRRLVENRIASIAPILFVLVAAQLGAATIVAVMTYRRWGVAGSVLGLVALVAAVYLIAIGAPKARALADLDRAALRMAGTVGLWATRGPLALIGMPVRRLARSGDISEEETDSPAVSEDELLALAELAAVDHAIEAEEQELIESTIAFGDTIAREVMVPRPDMITISADADLKDAMEVVVLHGYSRLPVTGDGIDDIVGIVHAKDLMALLVRGGDSSLRQVAREPVVVPETKHISKLMREMQAEMFHLAIVVDEYGGTAGLVALEDLIEELIGEIVDEFDYEEPMIEALNSGAARVNGKASLSSLEGLLGTRLPEGDWSTVGGLIFNTLGHVPETGETVDVDGHRLVVERIQGRRIARVRIEPANSPEQVSGAA